MDLTVDGMVPSQIVPVSTADDVRGVIAAANRDRRGVIAWGGGTRVGIGSTPARYDVALDVRPLRGVIEHSPADLVCTVRAGTTLAELADALAPRGQRWPVDAAAPARATVGGTIASAAPAPSRLRFQHPRDWTIGCSAVLGDGTAARAGGRVVKNVTGYDLTRLYSGTYGTLAVLTEVSLKLVAIDEARVTLRIDGADAARALRLREQLPFEAIVLTPTALYLRIAGAGAAVARVLSGVGMGKEVDDRELDELLERTLGGALVARCVVAPGTEAALVPTADFAFVGTGIAYVCRRIPLEQIAALRERCEQGGGALVLERASLADKQALGVWGRPRIPASIASALKARFDPHDVLAPGRMPT